MLTKDEVERYLSMVTKHFIDEGKTCSPRASDFLTGTFQPVPITFNIGDGSEIEGLVVDLWENGVIIAEAYDSGDDEEDEHQKVQATVCNFAILAYSVINYMSYQDEGDFD